MTPPTATTTAPAARPEVVTRGVAAKRQAWIERASSADHKVIGQMFIATALTFLALAALEFMLMRLQLIVPENTLIKPEIFSRLLTASVSSFTVLFAVPLALGLISYVTPLQIGARGTALPRIGQLGYWLYLMGAVTIYASFLYAAPETGTIGLPPLSDLAFSPSNGADAWIAGTALAILGFICFAINMLVTLNRLRAPGVAWRRMPLFSWAATVINAILLVVGPAMIAALAMLFVDRRFDGVFFEAGEGGAPLFYEHIGYLFLTGIYLIVFLFAAGVISEILPTFARKPIFSHRAVSASFMAVGLLGLLAWMQNMYSAPLNEGWTIAAMAFALALLVPIGLIFYNWIATLWSGTLRLRAASWYALIAVSTMACGLAGEFGYSVIPVGWALANTTASQGDTIYLLIGGGVFGGFAALHYWYPKLNGRLLGETLGKISLATMFIGIHLYVIPMFLAGLEGQPVDVFKYYEDTRRRRLQPDRLDRRDHLLPRRRPPARRTPPTAGTTASAPPGPTRGAARRSSGSRSRRRRRTTSTPSRTCARPSRSMTSAPRSAPGWGPSSSPSRWPPSPPTSPSTSRSRTTASPHRRRRMRPRRLIRRHRRRATRAPKPAIVRAPKRPR